MSAYSVNRQRREITVPFCSPQIYYHIRNLIQVFLSRNEHYIGLLPLNAPSAMQINASMSIIGSECLSQSNGKWTCRIRRYLLQILYLLEDEFQMSYDGKKSKKQPIDYALEYIHSNYHLGLTLEFNT